MDFWNNKDNEYKLKMIDVYNEQVKDLVRIVPTFKVANDTIHFDETSPRIHIVGVPIIENCTRGMKKQVGKTKLFTKTSLTEIQDKMRNACIVSYNKFYEVNTKLKEKQKGRNQDINVNEMGNYREIKKQLKQKEQKLEKANNQTKMLDNSSNDIKEIFNMENEKVKNVINIIKYMNIKDKLRLGVCLTTSDWANILYNRNEIYKKFDIMLKEIDEEYRTTPINFVKYKVVMFTIAKIMEMQQDERNKITLYLVNNLNVC